MTGNHRPDGHVDPEGLTPGDRAQLDQNWAAANDALDAFIAGVYAHRAEGCTDWFCLLEDTVDLLNDLELHHVHLMLRAAVERIVDGG